MMACDLCRYDDPYKPAQCGADWFDGHWLCAACTTTYRAELVAERILPRTSMCAECAFARRVRHTAFKEPRNRIVSQICAAGPLPFYCHEGLPWRESEIHLLSARDLSKMADGGLRVCAGWLKAVGRRRWPRDPALRRYQRFLARSALYTAERLLEGNASVRELQRDLMPLGEYYRGPRAWQLKGMIR
ncbi:MAG TPA: hypothetical protein VIX19_11530 [Terriglobales bacterium]